MFKEDVGLKFLYNIWIVSARGHNTEHVYAQYST